jgi:hypothetical protein
MKRRALLGHLPSHRELCALSGRKGLPLEMGHAKSLLRFYPSGECIRLWPADGGHTEKTWVKRGLDTPSSVLV